MGGSWRYEGRHTHWRLGTPTMGTKIVMERWIDSRKPGEV